MAYDPPTIHRAGDRRRAFAILRLSAQHPDFRPPTNWVPPWDERAHALAPMLAAHHILSGLYPHPDSINS